MASSPVATRRPPARSPRPGTRATPRRRRPAGRKRSRRRLPKIGGAGWLLIAVAALLLLAWSWNPPSSPPDGAAAQLVPSDCSVPGSGELLSPERVANARTIAQVGQSRGLPPHAVVVALATAMQESGLRNLDYGDRDSLGLFQQRPSQGWGTPAQVQDPVYAANAFYDRLVRVPGWEGMRLTDAAQAVQRSAFGEYYQKHEKDAVALAAALTTSTWHCG